MDAARHGYREEVQNFFTIFYADDGLIAARCPIKLQSAIDILVALFEHVGLRTNTSKTKVMMCVPGKIRTRLTDEVYQHRQVGLSTR